MPRRRQQKVLAPVPEDEELAEVTEIAEEAPTSNTNLQDDNILQLIERLEQQIQERAHELLEAAEAEARAIMNLFAVQLVKLPKTVKEMPLGQFKDDYGSDISAVLLRDINKRLGPSQAAPTTVARGAATSERAAATVMRTTRKRRDIGEAAQQQDLAITELKGQRRGRAALEAVKENMVAETPAAGPSKMGISFTPAAPATLMRVPKLGEVFYSQRGSPLGVVEEDPLTKQTVLNTVAKGGRNMMTPMPGGLAKQSNMVATVLNRKKGSKKGVADSMVVTTRDGEVVTVDLKTGLNSVPEQYREDVAEQLEALRSLATVALNNVTRRR